MTEKDATHSVTVTNGMAQPVNGVLTSTFGYRKHPILGVVRLHKGVDWKAPVGTPIMAAFDGTIAYVGDGKGYGNVIRIDHGSGRATAYAHMSRFEPAMQKGPRGACRRCHRLCRHHRAVDRPAPAFRALPERCRRSIRWAAPRPRCRRARPRRTMDRRTPGGDAAAARLRAVRRRCRRKAGQPDHPCGERRLRPRQEPEIVGHRAWPVHQVDLDADDEVLSSGALPIDVDGRACWRCASTRRSRARWWPTWRARTKPGCATTATASPRAGSTSPTSLASDGAHQVLAASGEASIAALMGDFGHHRQSFPDRQELRVRDQLGGEEDERQGGDLLRRRRRSTPTTVVKTSPEFIRYRETMQKIVEIVTSPSDHVRRVRADRLSMAMTPGMPALPASKPLRHLVLERPRPSRRPWRS